MEKQSGKGDGSDIGDCSDNDLNKGSDDVVNFVKSPKHMSNIQLVLPHKINYICFGTIVSVISFVVTVVMLVVISNDDRQNVFQLTKEISRISNHLERLSSKKQCQSSTTDARQTCEKINTSYLYYAIQAENRRLKDELQKTKSIKEDQKNCFQLTKDISRISDQLKSLPKTQISESSTRDVQQTCDKINTSYLYYAIQTENKRLNDELQETKSRKDSITCADTDDKSNQQEGREVTSANNIYGWIVANRSLSFGSSDKFNIIIKFELLYPEIPDNGKILFEFGLTTLADHLKFNNPAIIVRGQRCEKKPGMCLYVKDNVLTKLEDHVFDQISDYMQGELTLELHKSYFVLMSNQKNIYISNMLNFRSKVELLPVFGFYNTHLIYISQTIFSENKIIFNRTTGDPHVFVSDENNTITNCKLWSIGTSLTGWDAYIMLSETTFFIAFTISSCLIMINDTSKDSFVRALAVISILMSLILCIPLSLYCLYINWSLHLRFVASTFVGKILYDLKYGTSNKEPVEIFFITFFYSTYFAVFFKRSDIFYLIFY